MASARVVVITWPIEIGQDWKARMHSVLLSIGTTKFHHSSFRQCISGICWLWKTIPDALFMKWSIGEEGTSRQRRRSMRTVARRARPAPARAAGRKHTHTTTTTTNNRRPKSDDVEAHAGISVVLYRAAETGANQKVATNAERKRSVDPALAARTVAALGAQADCPAVTPYERVLVGMALGYSERDVAYHHKNEGGAFSAVYFARARRTLGVAESVAVADAGMPRVAKKPPATTPTAETPAAGPSAEAPEEDEAGEKRGQAVGE